ncbi:MAG TPA: hypothetical protein VGH51_03940 [Candidatus Angelobacter sp.]
MRKWTSFGVMTLLCATLAYTQATQPKPPPQQGAFDAQIASRLLLQLNEALQGHSQKQFLALFDLARMKDGTLFKQQITSFFSQTDSIRVHLNLSETAQDGDRATMAVEAEMEAEPSNGGPIARRNERLNFVAANSGGSWKFVDLQPRSFFSLP